MSNRILVTGGSGFIGSHYCRAALAAGDQVTVLTRHRQRAAERLPASAQLQFITALDDLDSLAPFDRLLNLAGESLADKRWSRSRVKALYASRIGLTQQLAEKFADLGHAPHTVVSGSAIGYYGHGSKPQREDGIGRDGFSHRLCNAWEQAALGFEDLGSRVVWLRTGIVLGEQGALQKMLPAFRWALGGPIGSGKQWMSWVHVDDMVGLIRHAMARSDLRHGFNATAPNPVTNAEFARQLGRALHRPARLPMPALAVKLLFGAMGEELLLNGQNVVPGKALESGYRFNYPELAGALQSVV